MFKRVSLSVLLGLIGGVAAFVLQELLVDNSAIMGELKTALVESTKQGLIVGFVMCLFLGSSDRMGRGDSRGAMRQAGMAGLYGLVGGFISLNLSNAFYTVLSKALGDPVVYGHTDFGGYALDLIPRSLGWMLLGAGLGLTASLPSGSSRRTWHATIGGGLGGIIAGILFVLLSMTLGSIMAGLTGKATEIGVFGRAAGFTVVGGAVGFFMSIIKEMMKSAWIEVILARNESQEYPIDKTRNIIGRAETTDVPLYGDPAVAPQQAAIIWTDAGFILQNLNTNLVVSQNNGAPGKLKHGDVIRVGSFTLRFCEKKGRAASKQRDIAEKQHRPLADPSGVCPYCGQKPDPKTGNCACSAPNAQRPPSPSQSASATVTELRVINGVHSGAIVKLSQVLSIGRDANCQIQLSEDTLVSRRHARVEPRNNTWVVIDEGSSNGTFVNGQRIQESDIKPGDILTIGKTTLQVG